MNPPEPPRMAILVTGEPYRVRAARDDVDIPLAAAAMNFPLDVFFLGDAVLQLALERDSARASLPTGYRGWAALPDLCDEFRVGAEAKWLAKCEAWGIDLVLPVEALETGEIRRAWRKASHCLVL